MIRQAIITKYLPYTGKRGPRVQAKAVAKTIYVAWNHNLNVEQNHNAAAKELATRLKWDGVWYGGAMPDNKGNCYVNGPTGSDWVFMT